MAIISASDYKTYAGITGTENDALITTLITRAQAAIEAYCLRTFDSTTYYDRYDGDGSDTLILNQYPITGVAAVGIGLTDVIRLTNTSSDAYNATIKIASGTMTLEIHGGANDGTSTFTLSSYTFTTLVAAINALGTGWTAVLQASDYAAWDAIELLETYGQQCHDQHAYIAAPQELIANFKVYQDRGMLEYDSYFPSGYQNISVRYTAGYSSTTMPDGLKQVCIDLVQHYYQSRDRDLAVSAESLGDHKIAYAQRTSVSGNRSLPGDIASQLTPYRKISIG